MAPRNDTTAAGEDAHVHAHAHSNAVAPYTENELAWHRAETERLRVLVDFLARPIHAPGGPEPDPDVLTAYNLAIEAALKGIRRAAAGRPAAQPRD